MHTGEKLKLPSDKWLLVAQFAIIIGLFGYTRSHVINEVVTLGLGLLWVGTGILLLRRLRESDHNSLPASTISHETLLQNIVDQSPVFIYTVDADGRYVLVNDKFQHWAGSGDRELTGKEHREIFSQPIATEFENIDRDVLRSCEPLETEHTFAHNGRETTLLGSRFCIIDENGNASGVCFIATDISVRKMTETRLQESEQNFRLLTENANDGILVNLNGRHVFANKRIIEMLEYDSIEDFIGTGIKDVVPPRLYQEIATRAKNRIYHHQQPDHYETAFITKKGKEIPFDMTVAVTSWQGQPAGFAILRDIRERKKNEEEIRRHKEHLEDLVSERTARLQAANKELEAFSYSVSHDLRSPLRSIDGFSQILLEDYSDSLDDNGKDCLNRIRGGAQRMSRLIDDILSLSRLSSEKLHIRSVDLSALASSVINELKQNYPDKPFHAVVSPGIPAQGDPRLLHIVLQNLIDNAFKYSSDKQQPYIEFGCHHNNDERQYYVRDNGIGFDMRYVKKLFSAFERLHNSKEYPGSGIGLASVARIVHRHGGKVWAQAEPNCGATFYFTTAPASAPDLVATESVDTESVVSEQSVDSTVH
ncbi:MAG: PAS domain S-box protein [Gammaproteobacteria bacterium]|nr:PAS domain S-box protein [Gammaproteobacteria bacterium]MDH5801047.1 PAS domain S-box protein [Gammaproteobacteria bacterium]